MASGLIKLLFFLPVHIHATACLTTMCSYVDARGPPLSILVDVIRNHVESWLDSLIPNLVPAILC